MTPIVDALPATANPAHIPDLTGWLLANAEAALEPAGYTVQLVETGPPPRQTSRPTAAGPSRTPKPRRVQVFGKWRVLRWRRVEAREPAVELLVARELLGETLPDNPGQ